MFNVFDILFVFIYVICVVFVIIVVDLVKKIPRDCSENDGKNARELVCLRVLESLSVLENGKMKADSGARISPSDCCEDVLIQVLLKIVRVCFSMLVTFYLFRDI